MTEPQINLNLINAIHYTEEHLATYGQNAYISLPVEVIRELLAAAVVMDMVDRRDELLLGRSMFEAAPGRSRRIDDALATHEQVVSPVSDSQK